MKEFSIAYPPAWTEPFTLEVSLKVSSPAALESIADALEHGFRDRGTAETSEDYVGRKAEEWLRRTFTEICRDQIAGNAMHSLQSQMTAACSIRQKTDIIPPPPAPDDDLPNPIPPQ